MVDSRTNLPQQNPKAMTPDYGFAKRPAWLIGHLVAVAAIVAFILLGFWQLRKHDERSAFDARIAERTIDAPMGLEKARELSVLELDFRQVAVTGKYDVAREVVQLAQTFNGRSGNYLLTPLVLDDGTAIVVNRGWIPIDFVGPPILGAEPTTVEVSIVGVARPAEIRRGLGPVDPPDGDLDRISRVDLNRLAPQFPYPIGDFYLQLVSPPSSDTIPLVLDLPEPGGGPPHLPYAVQWFIFAAVVAAGYPILLRSTARKGGESDS
ncbi:MAG: SURF1 family protein [bacterium]|nr:SURF1 family protein [bacterium]